MGNKNTHTHTERYTMGYYSAIKRKNLPFATIQMDLEGIIMRSEISQKRKKTIMYDFIACGSYETKLMNKCNKTETEYKYRRQRGGCQR